jgi:hypothetical protein
MKRCIVLAMIFLTAASGFSAPLLQDTSEIAFSGLLDFDSSEGTVTRVSAFYGYYVVDYIEVGPKVAFWNDASQTDWSLGVQSEYDIDLGTEFVPFFGVSVEYARVDDDDVPLRVPPEASDGEEFTTTIDQRAIVVAGQAGAKYFITEDVALSAQLEFNWATEDIYAEENGPQNTETRITVGLRFFY